MQIRGRISQQGLAVIDRGSDGEEQAGVTELASASDAKQALVLDLLKRPRT